MDRRIVSVWLPRLPTDLASRRRPAWRHEPLALFLESGQKLSVAAVNAPAEAAGVLPGMTLADARALEAGLATAPLRPEAGRKCLAALLRWADAYTPAAAIDGEDGLFLDMTGALGLFGGAARLMERLLQDFARLGFEARVAMAETAGLAWALARYGRENGAVAPAGRLRETAAALPVEALRLEPETAARLKRLGVTRIEDLLAMPRQALARRFGVAVIGRLDQALGAAAEPLQLARPSAAYRARVSFVDPVTERGALEMALDRLIPDLAVRLARDMLGAEALVFAVRRVDGAWQAIEAAAAAPTLDRDRIRRLFDEKLDRIDPGFGIEAASLVARRTSPMAARQTDVLTAKSAPVALEALIDKLGDRLGFEAVLRLEPRQSWLPGESARLVPARGAAAAEAWPPAPGPRPFRLLRRPLPVQVEAPPDALSPPSALYRAGARRQVRHAAGPERITPEWRREDLDWKDARDYWRIEDEAGERLWLYREAGQADRWFLHGFFP